MALRNGLSEELNRQGNEHFARGHYTDAYACYAKALECDRLTGDQRALIDEALRQRDIYLQHVIAERHATPRDDLISALIAVEEAGDQLNDGEILTMCGLLLVS